MSISRHISPITPYQSPGPDGQRPTKRQRTERDFTSNGYESPDELAPSPVATSPAARARPVDTRTGRPPATNGSRPQEIRPQENDRTGNREESPDELDHTFFLRRNSSNGLPLRIQSDASDTAESETGFQASSVVPSPSPITEARPPEVHYQPKLILRGHKRGVAAVKFSPDGKWIASCSADATCKIWDANTGQHQHTFEGHLAGVSTIDWSPDSKILASGSDDKSIRLWHVTTGKPHAEPFLGHHNYVYCVAFSPKGNMLVSGSYDEAVFLWDVRTGRLMRSLPAHSDPVGGVSFVRDGTLIVSCASDGLVRVWDTGTGQCLRTFFHEDNTAVVSVQFSPNGKYILAWVLDSTVRMWNYVEAKCVKTYQGHVNKSYSLGGAFGTYGTTPSAFVVSGSEDGDILFWDVNSKTILQRLGGHAGAVLGVDTHPTQKAIVSCGLDKTVRVWRDETSVTTNGTHA